VKTCMGLVCESLLDMQWSCLEDLPVNNGMEVTERDSEARVLLQAQPYCPGGFHWPLGRGDLKEDEGVTGTVQEKGSKQGLEKIGKEDSWQNVLLTVFVSVQKETEIGQIRRAVVRHDSD